MSHEDGSWTNVAQVQHLQHIFLNFSNFPKTFSKHSLATNPKHAYFRFVVQCRQGISHFENILKMFFKELTWLFFLKTFSKRFQNVLKFLHTLSTLCNKLKTSAFCVYCKRMLWKYFWESCSCIQSFKLDSMKHLTAIPVNVNILRLSNLSKKCKTIKTPDFILLTNIISISCQ